MKILGIILLVVILSIAVPTRDKWSYKAMYDRNSNSDTGHNWDERPINKDEPERYKKRGNRQ